MAVVRDALDVQKVKLLKTDPEKYFNEGRRQPFGFAVQQSASDSAPSERSK